VDGDFPPVRKLVPESSPIKAILNVADLIEGTRRVALVAERNAPIRISLSEGQAVLDAGAGDDAQASESIDCTLEGDSIVVAFNPQYLLDGLGVINTKYVQLALSHPNKPVLFTGMTEPDNGEITEYRYLLVPIRFAS
jgi:DNA polymerase-3 subunit beta